MENIYIQTSQNINLEQSVASIGERILAQLIDYLLFAAYGLIVAIVYSIVNDLFSINSTVIPILLMLPIVLYDLLCEIFYNGQNVGKRVMKLKVVMVDGSQPEFMAYFIRWMFRIVDTSISLGSVATLTIIFNGKGRRLGDIAAGTRVIRLKPVESKSFLSAPQLPPDYQPAFLESENLSDKDYAILLELFEFRLQNINTYSVQKLMENAKAQFCTKLNINTNLPAKNFLNALEKDYVYFNSQKFKD
jgi:uncharacterized RDD family membrane protein YckC